jgi:hypothetical protein
MDKLTKLALEIAITTPKSQNSFAKCAYVPWPLIHELRTELNRLGVDVEDTRKRFLAILKQRKEGNAQT